MVNCEGESHTSMQSAILLRRSLQERIGLVCVPMGIQRIRCYLAAFHPDGHDGESGGRILPPPLSKETPCFLV